MLVMRLSLLRHGTTDVTRSQLCGRTLGIPLNGRGHAEAQALAKRLVKPNLLFTSPIQRALETAGAIGNQHGITPVIASAFTEFDFGEWTGSSFESLHRDPRWREFNDHRQVTRAPGGESMSDVLARAVAAIGEFATLYPGVENIAIVSHGDVIRSLLIHAAETTLDAYWRFTVDPASITELEWYSPTSARILRANDTGHLENLVP